MCPIFLAVLLSSAASLARPDMNSPFFLDVSVTPTVVNGVLFQKQRGMRRVLMYVNVSLEPIEQKQPECTKFAVAIVKILVKTSPMVKL